ncbi:hypothetical protein Prum_057050 [Phytohabitans rumicis]|uniref:DUF4097 domain-containing protein n=1 Tax=Phytohabitans rumicis TaxID=1076125 RepID=A0A6V8L474_9ACTN|nr:hypothetical protein Prum_057050 [Phytohabitans rumicis]
MIGAVGALALVGCEEVGQSRLDYSDTENVAIKEILIDPGSGNVTVRTSDTDKVDIKRVVRYRGEEGEPNAQYHLNGTVLQIGTECGRGCSIDYEIVAPKGVAVRGENGSGDISLNGVSTVDLQLGSGHIGVVGASGSVKVHTGSGDVTVADVAGDLDARTGSGGIEARGVGGTSSTLRTGSGDVTLELTKAGGVRTHTGSGNVDITVPAGSYRVDARTGSGEKMLGVPNSPTGTYLLDLETGSGDITLREV